MLKKLVISLILVAFVTVLCLPNMIYAMDDIIGAGDNFIGKANETVINETQLKTTSNYIYNILFTIAVVLAIAVGMIIGIQFMMGSVDDKAKIKETLIPYVVGVFVVFGAFTIWGITINIVNNIPASEHITNGIIEETIDVSTLTDSELKIQFSANGIGRNLGELTGPRLGLSLTEAIHRLSEYQREIYYECQERGLLNESGIGLK